MQKLPRFTCLLEDCPNTCKRSTAKFCSKTCEGKYRTLHKIKQGGPKGTIQKRYCKFCMKKFMPNNYKDSQKYCTMSCAGKARAHVTKALGERQADKPKSKKARLNMSKAAVKRFRGKQAYSRCKGGFRKDIGHYVRSGWEANFARYLICLNKEYEYESDTFKLETSKRYYLYTPDFKVGNIFYEIKGYWDKKSLRKKRLFAAQCPKIKIIYISEKEYKEIEREFKDKISTWE